MDYKSYLLFGLIISAVVAVGLFKWLGWFSTSHSLITALIIILLYSILPDIDHPISKITWIFIGIGIIGIGVAIMVKGYSSLIYPSFGLLVLTYIGTQWFNHRGFIHSITAGVLFSLPIYMLIGLPYAVIAFIAYYSHLLCDSEPFKFM